MSIINILPPQLADMIAAGEVVERPASVIKELVENSIDAGAKNITIEIKAGGVPYIRVSDNGSGMGADDAGLCFSRHATSKLHTSRDLEAISTMGFRGEALAAISSISRIELITRREEDEDGIKVSLEGGEIMDMSPCGASVGTTIIVRDLFYNTPARLKFLKSDRAEAASCVGVALRSAMANPDVSVCLIRDNKEEFFSLGDGKISSCIASLLGRDTAKELIPCFSEDDEITVEGMISSPRYGRGNRGQQYFFCNSRPIKSLQIQTALERAYKNNLLGGRFPSCCLNIKISTASVDVNVHPSKLEVKFRDEKKVFSAVYNACLNAIENEEKLAEQTLSEYAPKPKIRMETYIPQVLTPVVEKKIEEQVEKVSSFFKDEPKETFAPKFFEEEKKEEPKKSSGIKELTVEDLVNSPYQKPVNYDVDTSPVEIKPSKLIFCQTEAPLPYKKEENEGIMIPLLDEGEGEITKELPSIEEAHEKAKASEIFFIDEESTLVDLKPQIRLIGETMKTYIIVEYQNELILIDKHAAHERMLFNKIKAQGHNAMSQGLLCPETMRATIEQQELVEENRELLESYGFEIDLFGEDSLIIRAVPETLTDCEIAPVIEEILYKLSLGALTKDELQDDIFHSIACKAAIKANYITQNEELLQIAKEAIFGEAKYCPHGRPTKVSFSKKRLDKEFSRII